MRLENLSQFRIKSTRGTCRKYQSHNIKGLGKTITLKSNSVLSSRLEDWKHVVNLSVMSIHIYSGI